MAGKDTRKIKIKDIPVTPKNAKRVKGGPTAVEMPGQYLHPDLMKPAPMLGGSINFQK